MKSRFRFLYRRFILVAPGAALPAVVPVIFPAPALANGQSQLPPNLRDSTLQQQLQAARRDMAAVSTNRPALWGESPLWSRSPLHAAHEDGQVTQGEFLNALSDQLPTLGKMRDWRAVARGRDRNNAPTTARSFKLGKPRGGQQASLLIGAQALPQWGLANFAGMTPRGAAPASVVKWGRVQAGSTAPLLALNRAAREYDELMETPVNPEDAMAPKLSWLQMRAVEKKGASLDFMAARGQRALLPGAAQTPGGTVWGTRGQMALFPKKLKNWNLRGEWLGSRLESQEKSAQSWNIGVDGPVAHPFGEARVSAAYSETDPRFASFSDPSAAQNAANPERRTREEVRLVQDAKLNLPVGLLTGSAGLTAARSQRKNLDESIAELASRETQTDEVTGTANLRWQLLPSVAMTGRHTRGFIWEDRPDAPQAPENVTERNDSDAGVELKMSRSLALTLGAGQTRIGNQMLPPEEVNPLAASLRDEERLTVGVARRTGGGAWSLNVARRLVDSDTLDNAATTEGSGDALAHTVNLDAERRFFSWLNLRGGWSWNNEENFARGNDGLIAPATLRTQSRRAEAQISLPFSSRFDVRYQDWLQQSGASGAMALLPNATREIGARYLVGAQEGQAGLAFSVEYSRRDLGAADPLNTWRLGLTYR